MSYEVTATRRRPQQFNDLVGQEFVAETLKNSIKSQKIAHAYLFSGPRGCGKTSTARILAKALNCHNGPTDTPCGVCPACQAITKGSSLDVIEIDGASNTSVENIRHIKDEVLFPPTNSKYKIYIIDEVHMLSNSAFNALLKTIEEPPPYVVFIFATTELQKVPATIKSRCQQYNFRLVSIDKVKQCLSDAAAELNIQADDEALFWVARESTGSMRDAYTLFDQVVAFSDGYITYEKIRDKLGLVGIDRLNTIFEACVQNKTDEVLTILDEFLQAGVSVEQLISNCAEYLRSLLFIKNGVTRESLLGNSPERYSRIVLNAWNSVQIERALSIYLQLYRDIRYSLSQRFELELAFSRMCWIGQYVSSVEVKKAIDAAQALLSGAPVSAPAKIVQTEKPVSVPVQPHHPVPEEPVVSPVSDPTGINPIPTGLPRLSMLDNMEDEPESEPQDSQGEPNPFHNGGPLPPEQSVEADANLNAEAFSERNQPAEIDERLKIHIPQENITSDGVVPTVYIPESSTGYTLNPDSEDAGEGWSNEDTTSESEYYPDDNELAEKAEQVYEAAENSMPEENQAQLDDTFTTADGTVLSIAQLRGNVMASLSITDGFAASNLEKTGLWEVSDSAVKTTVLEAYDLELIKKKNMVIASEISKICGKPMQFLVELKEQVIQENKAPVKIPEQVEILVKTFKGTIVAGKM